MSLEVSVKIDSEISDFVDVLRKEAKEFLLTKGPKEEPLSKEAIKYKKILSSMSRNCDSDVVNGLARILSVMLDESITVKTSGGKGGYKKFMVVVPVKNPNGHDYELNDPVCIRHRDMGVDWNLRCGNHLPPIGGKATRLATEDEIDKYMDTLTITLALQARGVGVVKTLTNARSIFEITG